MEFKATLTKGPIEFEIWAEDGDEAREELQNTIQFLEDEITGHGDIPSIDQSPGNQISGDEEGINKKTGSGDESNPDDDNVPEDSLLAKVSSELRVPIGELEQVFIVEPDEEMPMLYLDDKKALGDRQTDRQRRASLMLLYLWHTIYGENRVKSSSLKDALQMSGISDSGMGNMYQGKGDSYFDRSGRGPSATVALTPPGKRHARREIQELMEDLGDEMTTETESSEEDKRLGEF